MSGMQIYQGWRAMQEKNNISYREHNPRRNPPTPGTVAFRAIQLRKAMAPTAAAFCRFIGINYRRWHNIEGGAPCSRLLAEIIAERCAGLPVEWLPYGNTNRMPPYWQERLYGETF